MTGSQNQAYALLGPDELARFIEESPPERRDYWRRVAVEMCAASDEIRQEAIRRRQNR